MVAGPRTDAQRADDGTPGFELVGEYEGWVEHFRPTSGKGFIRRDGSGADGSGGVAFNLLNNMWLTNYILWYPWHQQEKGGSEEMLTLPVYRFLLEL